MNLTENYSTLSFKPGATEEYDKTRHTIPFEERRFFEGIRQVWGQMLNAERKCLFEFIKRIKPETVFEVGTASGGGSTYFITQALWENGRGILYTVDINPDAKERYDKYLGYLMESVNFLTGDAIDVFKPILNKLGKLDVVLLDGSDFEKQTISQYEMFMKYIQPGNHLICHDWMTDKMKTLKPIVENDPKWKLIELLTSPVSVGFVIYERLP